MDSIKIADNLYWVGVRDSELRVFDIIMETKYGTTYNSYLIKGEKNILIDTAKINFYRDYEQKIQELLGDEKIDYIIVNHTEPDHSGSIKNMLAKYPGAQVICSKPAAMYLKAQFNEDFNHRTIADGEEINLGGKTFKFILAPFLHWPDTMFTYYTDEKVMFTCDAFGCHYCPEQTKIFNDETGDFKDAFRYYFDVIMGPFKEHVLKAIAKIRGMDIQIICTSHGPVLRNNLWQYVDLYEQWSRPAVEKHDKKYVLIGYVSAYGFTKTIAQKLFDTISENRELDVELIDISKHELMAVKAKIENADAILIGSPTFNQDALKPVWDALSVVCPINVRGKLAAAFGSYGWSGEAVKMLEERLKSLKFKVVESSLRFCFAPSDGDLITTGEFAQKFIEML